MELEEEAGVEEEEGGTRSDEKGKRKLGGSEG